LSRRLPFPGRLPYVAGLRRPDGQTSRTLSCYLPTDSPRSSIYSPATDQVLPKHDAGSHLGNVNQLSAHTLVTALNCIIRKSADGQVIQKLCTECSLVPLQVSNLRGTLYAFLTLAKDVELMSRLVDYGRSYVHVCRDVVNHIVNSTGTLGIICRPLAAVYPCLLSCVCQVKQHSFTASSLARRANADCLVGPSGRAIYSAGGRTPAKGLWCPEEGSVFLKAHRFVLDTV
jgi:hypothetical protein